MKYLLNDGWENLKEIILYGYGTVGRACFPSLSRDFDIVYIIDNDKNKHKEIMDGGVEVYSIANGIENRDDRKIIVTTGGRSYLEISNLLNKYGLKEYKDFCSIEYFITEWYWKYKKINALMEIHTAITMQCTLKCKYCNMFVPYYSEKIIYKLQTLQEEFELLFSKVDYIFCLTLLGGEPLLHPDLKEIIHNLFSKYKNKIGILKIITNGTVVLKDNILEELKDYPIWFSISDYTQQVKYEDKMKKVVNKFKEYGFDYSITQMVSWNDFYFPRKKFFLEIAECPAHMRACSPIFHGYNDKKIYYCHVAWSAEKIGKFRLSSKDYIDLRDISDDESKHSIAEHCMGNIEEGYVSFCQFCGGCGKDNDNYVLAGEQE